jgi:hypothetical protein
MPTSTDRGTAFTAAFLFGVSLIVGSLFFDWLEVPAGDSGVLTLNGWSALETGDALFVLIALVAVGLAYLRGLRGPWPLLLALTAAAVVVTYAVSTTPAAELADAAGEQNTSGSFDGHDFGPGIFIAAGGAALLLAMGLVEARAHVKDR